MALITINDLPQSIELDREAMLSVVGGARAGVRPADLEDAKVQSGRIVDYPPGFKRERAGRREQATPVGPMVAPRGA